MWTMNEKYILGVDIGGTHTDAVLVDKEEKVVAFVKTETTEDSSLGFKLAIATLLRNRGVCPTQIQSVFVGTTHATNAILQKTDLYKVGVVRIAGQRPDILPTAFSWPEELRQAVLLGSETIAGGFCCDGSLLTLFKEEEARAAIEQLLHLQVESIAVVGTFSPLNGEQEEMVASLIQEIAGSDFPISLSRQIGGIGFIERENSTLLNASLKKVMKKGFHSLETSLREIGILAELMITQNDGSAIDLKQAIEYPILTISAGPTNSFIGGARLAGKDSVIVVDIGGTSTDVGFVKRGFPLRSLNTSSIGGVMLDFSMPDVLSVALGGGSLVKITDYANYKVSIGPESVAKRLSMEALAFGGDTLTLTDVALSLGYLHIENAHLERIPVDPCLGEAVFHQVLEVIDELVCKMKGEHKHLPVVLVGGGCFLLPFSCLEGKYEIPPYSTVANAYGAALAEISGLVDTVVSLEHREQALRDIHEIAKQRGIALGAREETLRLVEERILPYSYIPNKMARVIVRYSGKKNYTGIFCTH